MKILIKENENKYLIPKEVENINFQIHIDAIKLFFNENIKNSTNQQDIETMKNYLAGIKVISKLTTSNLKTNRYYQYYQKNNQNIFNLDTEEYVNIKQHNQTTLIVKSINSMIEDDLNNFNIKNTKNYFFKNDIDKVKISLSVYNQMIEKIQFLFNFKYSFDKEKYISGKLVKQNYDCNLVFTQKIFDELKVVQNIFEKIIANNKNLDFSNFYEKDANQIEKSKKIDNISGFNGYYLFDLNQDGWISIVRKRTSSPEFRVGIEKNIADATIFSKKQDLVLKEFGLNKNNVAIIEAKIEPINLIIPANTKINSNELEAVDAIISKKNLNKIFDNEVVENKEIREEKVKKNKI